MRIPFISTLVYSCISVLMRIPFISTLIYSCIIIYIYSSCTRGNNILDQTFTNLQDFYMAPNRRCPFGLSDHLTITIFPAIRQKSVSEKRIIKVRDKRRSNISSLGRFFQNVPFEDILSSVQSPCEKLTIFTDIINYGLNTIMPERSIKVHVTDRPWMTNNLKTFGICNG